jgi:cell division protein FtsB
MKQIDDLRAKNLKAETDLINNFSDDRKIELERALEQSKKRNTELFDEIEMLKNNDTNSLESFYNYCCNDFDDCCYDDDNY